MRKGFGKKIPKKIECEICGEKNKAVLHKHHIIPRTDPKCTNDWLNVCIICANCHNKVHNFQINIIGIFPSTKTPYGRTLIFEVNGVSNVSGIQDIYCLAHNKEII